MIEVQFGFLIYGMFNYRFQNSSFASNDFGKMKCFNDLIALWIAHFLDYFHPAVLLELL